MVNHPDAFVHAKAAAEAVLGASNVVPLPRLNMGAEDFASYLQCIPGCYVRFGTEIPGVDEVSPHSSKWDMNEETLILGAQYFARVAREAGAALAK